MSGRIMIQVGLHADEASQVVERIINVERCRQVSVLLLNIMLQRSRTSPSPLATAKEGGLGHEAPCA